MWHADLEGGVITGALCRVRHLGMQMGQHRYVVLTETLWHADVGFGASQVRSE